MLKDRDLNWDGKPGNEANDIVINNHCIFSRRSMFLSFAVLHRRVRTSCSSSVITASARLCDQAMEHWQIKRFVLAYIHGKNSDPIARFFPFIPVHAAAGKQ